MVYHNYSCIFGNNSIDAHVINTTHVWCQSPKMNSTGALSFYVAYRNYSMTNEYRGVTFHVFDPPEVKEINLLYMSNVDGFLIYARAVGRGNGAASTPRRSNDANSKLTDCAGKLVSGNNDGRRSRPCTRAERRS